MSEDKLMKVIMSNQIGMVVSATVMVCAVIFIIHFVCMLYVLFE